MISQKILDMLNEGKSITEIAALLDIRVNTLTINIAAHNREQEYKKYNKKRFTELVKLYRQLKPHCEKRYTNYQPPEIDQHLRSTSINTFRINGGYKVKDSTLCAYMVKACETMVEELSFKGLSVIAYRTKIGELSQW